jgi:polysaccharide pyruvyl transferase WcaK-like protein
LIIAVVVGAGWQVYRDDQKKELLKAWGHSSLTWMSAVFDTSQHDAESATEPGAKLSDQAVTPSATSITIREFPELQQQLQNVVSDLATLQRLVEQVASKQEQISRDMTMLQAAEQNLDAKISSFTQPAAVRVAPRRNVARLVHSEAPRHPTAESQPVQPLAPEIPSPADQPPRPPLPLTTPPAEASSSAH